MFFYFYYYYSSSSSFFFFFAKQKNKPKENNLKRLKTNPETLFYENYHTKGIRNFVFIHPHSS